MLPLIIIPGVPLIAALICWRLRNATDAAKINLLAFAISVGFSIAVASKVLAAGTIEAAHGFFRADALSAIVLCLTSFVALACGIYAVGYMRQEVQTGTIDGRLLHRYYVLTPIFVGAMLMVPIVNNLGIMWVCLESTTLASVLLVRFYNHKSSLEAAWKYIIIGSAAIALALFGTVLTYFAAVGVLGERAESAGFNWSVLVTVADRCHPAAMRLAFVLVLVGYGTKAGLVPMHTWKPDAYAEAPVPSAALLGAGFINCAIYAIMRFYTLATKCLGERYTGSLLVLFGVASILVAAPFVITQRNFRRLLAYSSIDHAGIMVAALGFGGRLGILGAVLHMLFHAAIKPLMFFCAGNVQQHYRTAYLRKVTGVIHSLPWTGVLFLGAAFAVTGAPPFSIFQSEFTILCGAMDAGRAWSAALVVIGLVAIFSGFLVHLSRLTLGKPSYDGPPPVECPWKLGGMLLVAIPIVALAFSVPAPLYDLVHRAALIVGGAP